MAPSPSPRAATRRSRKSIAHVPTSENRNNENLAKGAAAAKANARKTRSKSLGPGGLEALGETSGNRQKTLPEIRSILKPSIPLSPPKPIPPHSSARKASPAKARSGSLSPSKPGQSGLGNLPNPFADGSPRKQTSDGGAQATIGVKSEEEQQAAAREREKKEIIERRDARRKSLANRRVSFAPEATLHTWDVMELPDDATTSSEATNSTRRASTASAMPASPYPPIGATQNVPESPETTTPSGGEVQSAASPANQREMHKKRRRRSSKIPPMNLNNAEDLSSSPISSISSDDSHQSFATAEGSVVDASDSDSDRDLVAEDGTVTGVDNDDSTGHSAMSEGSIGESSTSSSGRLEEALRQATFQAGNQDVMLDPDGDISIEMADQEVTNAFKPWTKQAASSGPTAANQVSLLDRDDMDPFFYNASAEDKANGSDDEMTMEMTQAMGGILPGQQAAQGSPTRGRRKSTAAPRRRASAGRRRSSGGSSAMADETMELTTAFGAIKQAPEAPAADTTGSLREDEDLSMELTTVIGPGIKAQDGTRRQSVSSSANDDEMDITAPLGRVLSPVTERTEPITDEETMGMDITTAMGAILPDGLKTDDRHKAKLIMEEEADHGQLTRSPFPTPEQTRAEEQRSLSTPTKPGTPSTMGGAGRLSIVRQSPQVRSSPRRTTPAKKPATPSRQVTPQPERPSTPNKTPLGKNVAMRKISPKRLFKSESKSPVARSSRTAVGKLEFKNDEATGSSVPSIILTPKQRRLSGVGIDQAGIGSPKVAQLLDRRGSIGETASEFTPQKKSGGVRFEDPRKLEQELDKERAEEHCRESGRGVLQMEVDAGQPDKDTTSSLKDMIKNLTPKKNKLRGRKSLHVGAAKGLLGKRPIELDEDEDDGSPKKYRGLEGSTSPVKGIHLPAPPSKEETTGRVTWASRASLAEVTGNVSTPTARSPTKDKVTTPRSQGRFRDVDVAKSPEKLPVTLNEQLAGAVPHKEENEDDDRIHLSDFLNMTSIRFMELTTTKRRHTIAPRKEASNADETLQMGVETGIGSHLADCVAAGACTIPMLELYQHSCRELKRYIAEGRTIVKEIEAETYEDNPALFREYLSAAPDVRAIMDNQFKNVKTHARLLSRGMWYEWRAKLLDGLRDGLVRIAADMARDDRLLEQQEALLKPVVPEMVQRHEQLEAQFRLLQSHADELASCNKEELGAARDRLTGLDGEIAEKRRLLREAQAQMADADERIEATEQRKAVCRAEMQEAERVREECRGWSSTEVAELKAKVDELESRTGWTITAASGPGLTLRYCNALSLLVHPSHFAPHARASTPNGPISLTLEDLPSPPNSPTATSTCFFLQLLRARLLALPQAAHPLRSVLALVAAGHAAARAVAAQIDALRDACYPTEVRIVGDAELEVAARVVLRASRTVVEVRFAVRPGGEPSEVGEGLDDGLRVRTSVAVEARVVYGEERNESRMSQFLTEKVAGKCEAWADAMNALEARLVAKGRKVPLAS